MSTVLLVEDDQVSAMMLTIFLEEAGYQVAHCATTDDALSHVQNNQVDFLLSDWSIDGSVSPADVARTLRERHPQAKIIFVSGYSQEQIEKEMGERVRCTIYSKPINAEELIANLPNLP